MKQTILLLSVVSIYSFAVDASSLPQPVINAAAKLKKQDTRTITTLIENSEKNPCLPQGKSYKIELQVKEATWNPIKSNIDYTWKTIKSVNSDLSGKIQEVCAE